MKKAYCILFSALLMVACGDDNSSSANDQELSSSSEEVAIESSSDEKIVSSSSEKKEEQNSSSSVQEANSSSDKAVSSSSVQEASSSSTENEQSSSSSNNQAISDFGDNKIVIKQIPTFGELDGKPYFYTTEPRCTYKNNVFSIKADTSDNAYFYEIANDTLTLYHVDLDKVLAGSYEEPSAKETYYGKNTNLESEWESLCYYNLNDDYTSCTQKYSYLISRDTIYNSLTYPIDYNYQIFKLVEKVSHSRLGIYDEMSAAQRATKYAENGISIDSTGTKTLISFKDKGTLSIDEITTKIINSNETIYTKIALSTDKKECVLTSERTPVKSSKYCSEEYLPYLQIDDYDGYVSTYAKGNQEEFDTCLESLFD
jgi:DNA mismatch repair ATPase MutL